MAKTITTNARTTDAWLAAHECAARIGLTVRALRLYEQRGLIRPRRTEKGWRLYGADEIARLHEVLALKRLGLSLARITALLQGKAIDLERTLAMQAVVLSEQRERAERGLALVGAAQATLAAGTPLSLDELIKLAKETNMTEAAADSVAQRRYEQARPRMAVRLDPAIIDRHVGHYRHPSGMIVAIDRKGDSLFIQLAGQPPCEMFPENDSKFFLKVVPAQVSFASVGGEPAGSLTLHQGGHELVAQRIDDSQAKAAAAALDDRIKSRTPQPGSEAALRAIIADQQEGRMARERMSDELAALVREQFPIVQAQLDAKGELQELAFEGVDQGGIDVYEAKFANGRLKWGIGLAGDGRAHTLWLRPAP